MWMPAEMKLIDILLMLAADFEVALATVEIQSYYVVAAPVPDLLEPPRAVTLRAVLTWRLL